MTSQAFDPKALLLEKIRARGGWVNAHLHLDRAYILDEKNFQLTGGSLKQKWDYPDKYKKAASVEVIYSHMARGLEKLLEQGVQAVGAFIDVDSIVKDKSIKAAQKLRDNFGRHIKLKFINQVVKGVIEPDARRWFERGAQFVDIIGGLPEKDAGHEAEHLDILFETAKKNGDKMLHVHIDQYNSPKQRDTELLVKKTIEHGHEGKVVAIHCISVGAQPQPYRHSLYQKMKAAGVMVISCPVAWIDSRRNETLTPTHNAITPVEEMIAAGLVVGLGQDHIKDIYKPFNDGDMWTELRFLLEACHLYDLDELSQIASTNGLKTLDL